MNSIDIQPVDIRQKSITRSKTRVDSFLVTDLSTISLLHDLKFQSKFQGSDEFYKNPTYFAMGHFSKFIRPGATSLFLDSDISTEGVTATAFRNPDDTVAIVLLNQ